MKYIFVCNHGQHRSAIAARVAKELGDECGVKLETDYFGVNDCLSNREKGKILEGADAVFVMEKNMFFDIKEVLRYEGKVICLDVSNREYERGNFPSFLEYKEEEREMRVKLMNSFCLLGFYRKK